MTIVLWSRVTYCCFFLNALQRHSKCSFSWPFYENSNGACGIRNVVFFTISCNICKNACKKHFFFTAQEWFYKKCSKECLCWHQIKQLPWQLTSDDSVCVSWRKMMDSGQLDFYEHSTLCTNTCRSTKFDLLINNTRFPLDGSGLNTPTTAQGQNTRILIIIIIIIQE